MCLRYGCFLVCLYSYTPAGGRCAWGMAVFLSVCIPHQITQDKHKTDYNMHYLSISHIKVLHSTNVHLKIWHKICKHCPWIIILKLWVNTVNHFYAPGLKGPPGASSVSIVCPSLCPSVHLSVRNSVPLTNKVQYLKFGWSYSNRTWTVSSSKGCSHFTDITCPWGWGGGQNVGLRHFCHSLTLLPPGASVFHKHMSCFVLFSRLSWELSFR